MFPNAIEDVNSISTRAVRLWWQLLGNRLGLRTSFSLCEYNPLSVKKKIYILFLVKKKCMFLFAFVSMPLSRFDFTLSACCLC